MPSVLDKQLPDKKLSKSKITYLGLIGIERWQLKSNILDERKIELDKADKSPTNRTTSHINKHAKSENIPEHHLGATQKITQNLPPTGTISESIAAIKKELKSTPSNSPKYDSQAHAKVTDSKLEEYSCRFDVRLWDDLFVIAELSDNARQSYDESRLLNSLLTKAGISLAPKRKEIFIFPRLKKAQYRSINAATESFVPIFRHFNSGKMLLCLGQKSLDFITKVVQHEFIKNKPSPILSHTLSDLIEEPQKRKETWATIKPIIDFYNTKE